MTARRAETERMLRGRRHRLVTVDRWEEGTSRLGGYDYQRPQSTGFLVVTASNHDLCLADYYRLVVIMVIIAVIAIIPRR